jgi:hypothetical protein
LNAGATGAAGWVYLGPTLHPLNKAIQIATAQTETAVITRMVDGNKVVIEAIQKPTVSLTVAAQQRRGSVTFLAFSVLGLFSIIIKNA